MKNFLKSMIATSVLSALSSTTVIAATYEVIDHGTTDSHKYAVAKKFNASNVNVASASSVFNFPVQFQYLDEDDYDDIRNLAEVRHETDTLLTDIEDFDALKAGTPTANDFAWVVKFLQSKANTSLYQKVGNASVLVNNGTGNTFSPIFDTQLTTTSLSYSADEFVNGVTNDGWVYGNASAPYLPLDFTESDGDEVTHWVRDFTTRAFVRLADGTIKSIVPEESRFGGESAILDINSNRFAVGYVSDKINVNVLETIEDETGGCADPDIIDDIPYEVCVWNRHESLYHLKAVKWQLDAEGNVLSTEDLGMAVNPHEDDERNFKAYAHAINEQGVAVGYAHGWIDESETSPSTSEPRSLYAVVYKNGQAIDFTDDHSDMYDSRAFDINDNGMAVGHVTKNINGDARTKFYYVDTTSDNMTMVLPKDFFNGSSSTARAINNNGLIVGEGEVETHNDNNGQNPRRRHGFVYDINNETFSNLNDLLTCESPYTIVQATDINDNNEILATAVFKEQRRDAFGQVILDANGNPRTEDVTRVVTLKPTGGEIDDCFVEEEKVTRKGAGVGITGLFLMLVVGFRRRFMR